jgi:selenocysteine lyase/cysteine desulfurase
VLPFYGNTHTTTSLTGLQTTKFREDARKIISSEVSARDELDQVLFVGAGATAAVNLLVRLIFPVYRAVEKINREFDAVVFLGPYEHHSNLLPWRELNHQGFNVEIVYIEEDHCGNGGLNLEQLENELKARENIKLKIGSFSAVSNLTGILTDTLKVTKILKTYGALSFWDYAAGSPYIQILMNPEGDVLYQKDAIFFSAHKLIGGVGGSGVLVVKKAILNGSCSSSSSRKKRNSIIRTVDNSLPHSPIPTSPGGGTVLFVTKSLQIYLDDAKEREESGTPNILSDIRAGLAFQLKSKVAIEFNEKTENDLSRQVIGRLMRHPKIFIHGNVDCPRIPIISLNILSSLQNSDTKFLHHTFVCALLNDLFGIQVRGGCACAGPYGQSLLSISKNLSSSVVEHLKLGRELLKGGVVRVSFCYIMNQDELSYICSAIEFIATHGWKFLGLYKYDLNSGQWKFDSSMEFLEPPFCLQSLNFESVSEKKSQSIKLAKNDEFLQNAFSIIDRFQKDGIPHRDDSSIDEYKEIRWFAVSSDLNLDDPSNTLESRVTPFAELSRKCDSAAENRRRKSTGTLGILKNLVSSKRQPKIEQM